MATHSSILTWKIPWTEEPGGLQSMASQRVGHDWVIKNFTFKNTFVLQKLILLIFSDLFVYNYSWYSFIILKMMSLQLYYLFHLNVILLNLSSFFPPFVTLSCLFSFIFQTTVSKGINYSLSCISIHFPLYQICLYHFLLLWGTICPSFLVINKINWYYIYIPIHQRV